MTFDIMLSVAKRVNELLPGNDVDGIVITHGTDTMEDTAFFLNLVVKSDKPVVVVRSMRPSTAISADGPLNLYNAVGVARDPRSKGRGVLVVMNDWIHAAHSLTKTSTTDVQTFMSPLRGLVGVSSYGSNDFYNVPPWKHTTTSVRSSRVALGTVGRNVEINDDQLGFVASDELNPQSRILLSLALLKPRPASELQQLFSTY